MSNFCNKRNHFKGKVLNLIREVACLASVSRLFERIAPMNETDFCLSHMPFLGAFNQSIGGGGGVGQIFY